MNHERLIESLKQFADRMFTVAEGKGSEAIKECPGWNVNDLMAHIGRVFGAVTSVIESKSIERPTAPFPTPPESNQREWAMSNFSNLFEAINETDPDTPLWTWGRDQNMRFFIRRMTHETLLHMRDAESVIGEFITVDGDVACDGIDEYIDGALQHSMNPQKEFLYPNGSIHLHRTDGEGEWLIEPNGNEIIVSREHAKGDVAVRGSAISLLLYLWGRSPQDLEIFGEPELAKAWGSLAP